MGFTLTDRERRFIALIEEETGASVRDCVVEEDRDRLLVVVAPDDMATAIGPDGRTVDELEDRLGREVRLVADAANAGDFVANALAPAAVYGVTVEETDDGELVATADVDPADRGVAIGEGGRNVDAARRLARRHFDVDDVRID